MVKAFFTAGSIPEIGEKYEGAIRGPGGCSSHEECEAYCRMHPEECQEWCRKTSMCPEERMGTPIQGEVGKMGKFEADVRFSLPIKSVELADYACGGFGAWGIHRGNHVEGLDHIWINVKPGTEVVAPTDGVVVRVEEPEKGDITLVISHGRFESSFYHLKKITVSEGDEVKRGEVVGYPRDDMVNGRCTGFDWALYDYLNNSGPTNSLEGGSYVSPL
jgi:hypothetical protein